MKLQSGAIILEKNNAIDNLLALMLVDAQCDAEVVCVAFLDSGAQCVVRKEVKGNEVEFSYRDGATGRSVALGGYRGDLAQEGVQKEWYRSGPAIVRLEVGEHLIESSLWNDRIFNIMTSLLSRMEVLSKTTKAGRCRLY